METTYQKPMVGRVVAPVKPIFRMFIACEDQAAYLQSERIQHQVDLLCGNEIKTSPDLWNFALLRHEQLREYAVKEAAEADMIVISLRESSELPPHVKCWLESLPVQPQAGQAALVVLIGSRKEPWPERRSHIAYLRRIAESRGLDFFCNQDNWEYQPFSPPAFRGFESSPLTLETVIAHHLPWSVGGINE